MTCHNLLEIAPCVSIQLVAAPHARARWTVSCGFQVIAFGGTANLCSISAFVDEESIDTRSSRGVVIRSKLAKNVENRPLLTEWSKCFAENFAIRKKSSCQNRNGTWREKRWSLTLKEAG